MVVVVVVGDMLLLWVEIGRVGVGRVVDGVNADGRRDRRDS